jgi:hypothetical protein
MVLTVGMVADRARGKQPAAGTGTEKDSRPGCLGAGSIAFIGGLAWLVGPGILRSVLISFEVLVFTSLIFSAAVRKKNPGPDADKTQLQRAVLFLPTAAFLLFFFVGHFGGFHAVHAVFLSLLVPAELNIPIEIESFADGREYLFSSFRGLVTAYWPYVLSVGIKNIFTYRDLFKTESKGNSMILPYRNVVRIHLLIFVLAPVALAGLGRPVTIIALFFFYFPVERVAGWVRGRKRSS